MQNSPTRLMALLVLLLPLALPPPLQARAPKADSKRIINQSLSFLKNREPEMTASEYALYERVVAMLAVQPEFAMQLLESMTSGKERPSAAFEFVLGNAHYSGGRTEQAEVHYRKAIEQYPDYLRAWTNLGVLHYSASRYGEAVRCLGKAIELGDGSGDTLGLMAYSLARTGHTVAAEVAYLRALSVQPECVDWIDGLCGLYIEDKLYGRAESLVRQLVRLQPRDPRHWQHYAGILLAQNRPDEAMVVLETARSLSATTPALLMQLGDLYAQSKFTVEAVGIYREVLADDPAAGANRLIGYAQALIDQGQLDEAAALLGHLPGEVPQRQRIPLRLVRAELAAGRKDWAAARRELEAVLGDAPLHAAALLRLGQVNKAAGALAAARQAFEAAARRPESAYRAQLELADIELRDRHYSQCAEHLEQALAVERSPAIRAYLEKVKTLVTQDENTPR